MRTDGSDALERNGRGKSLEKSPANTLKDLMNGEYVKRRFAEVMGDKAPAFIASVLSATQKNPELAQCEPQSILASAMVAATLDLPIDSNLGFAALVPYKVKRKDAQGRECWASLAQFQIMYKGFVQFALRSGQYKTINVAPVYADEFESYDIVTGDVFIHPVAGGYRDQENWEKIVGYVAFFRLLNGYERKEFWSIKKFEAHGKKYSKAYDKSFSLWKKDPHVMYAKTVLKNTLSKWGILSVSMQTAMIADQSVVSVFDKPIDSDNVSYVDNADWQSVPAESAGTEMAEPGNAPATANPVPAQPPAENPPPSTPAPVSRKSKIGLFSPDESADLEAQYAQDQAGPQFAD